MKRESRPVIYLISGPNGAGKTTCAFSIMPELIDCYEYVNADAIAAGLSPFRPLEVSVDAGRLMLKRIRELTESGATFAFETTLSSKSFAPFLARCKRQGYTIRLIYIWVNSVELAVERVKRRAEIGGHLVAEQIIRRRYPRSLLNFFHLYSSLADIWGFYDNSYVEPELVAERLLDGKLRVFNRPVWRTITSDLNNEGK